MSVAALLNLMFKHIRKAISNKVEDCVNSAQLVPCFLKLCCNQGNLLFWKVSGCLKKTLKSLELERKLRAFLKLCGRNSNTGKNNGAKVSAEIDTCTGVAPGEAID